MMLVEDAAPEAGALPVAALRDYLRMGSGFDLADDPAENAALAGFLRAAIATVEARTGKVLLRRPFRLRLKEWRDRSGQPLPLAPVASVDAIEIDDGMGTVTPVPPDRWRLLADDQRPIVLPGGAFLPAVPSRGSVDVHFTAGFSDNWEGVPADLAQAVLMLAARYHDDRGSSHSAAGLPFGVSALLERWRAVRTLAGRGGRA